MGRYVTTKTYDHNEGLTCAYRIWKSATRRRFLHGHSLNVKMVFECTIMDPSDQVMDIIDFDEIEEWLQQTFGHTTCVADDDPQLDRFQFMHAAQMIDLRIMPGVGCERFAEMIWHRIQGWLAEKDLNPRVSIRTVEVRENQADSALYLG